MVLRSLYFYVCQLLTIKFSRLIWLEQVASNSKVVGLIPLWAICLRVGLDPCGAQFRVFCDSVKLVLL